MKKARIFIVEDEAAITVELKNRLQFLGYEVCGIAARVEDAIAQAPEMRPDLVLMDVRLAGNRDGVETAERLSERITAPVVYLTAGVDSALLERAKISAPYGCLVKPFNEPELIATIELALYKHAAGLRLQESEQRYRQLFDSAGDGIFILDAEGPETGRIVAANNAAAAMHGYTRDELLRLKIADIDAPDAAMSVPALFERMLKGEWIKKELTHRRKDGVEFSVEISAGVMVREGHKYILAFDRDITDRKLAEQTLRQTMDIQAAVNEILRISLSGARIEEILRQSLDIILSVPSLSFESKGTIFLADISERILKLSACKGVHEGLRTACGRLPFGRCLCGRVAESKQLLFVSDVDERHENVYDGMHSHGHYCVPILEGLNLLGVFTIYVKPGHQRQRAEEDFLTAVADTLAGVIIRKQATDATRESESKFKTLFDLLTDGIFIVDAQGNFIDINQTAHERLGYTKREMLAMGIRNLDTPEFSAQVPERFKKILRGGQAIFESAHKKKDGTIMPVEINSRIIDFQGKQVFFSVIRDITERKQAEQDLKKRELQLSESQRIAHIGSWERDLVTNRITWSEETFRIFGLDPAAGPPAFQTFLNAIHPDDRGGSVAAITDTVSTGKSYNVEFRIYGPEGAERIVSALGELIRDESGTPALIRGTLQDITERKGAEKDKQKLQNQLAQAQKMETVGQLAGGVAHDFNNILTAILGDAYILGMKLGEQSPLTQYVDDIRTSSEKAAVLTQSLLAFSRKQILNPKPVDLNIVIRKLHKLTARLIGEDIDYKTALTDSELIVFADSGQIEQVLINLITNARDSMPRGGKLSIASKLASLDDAFIAARGFGAPGDYALISVTDSGAGMDADIREKIFEPFFTTKEVGKGTGLGLSIAYGIIKQHNGFIDCVSAPGKGTVFNIYMPLIHEERHTEEEIRTGVPERGREALLLAEDDDTVRKTTKAVIEEFGYRVIEAVDGEDAIRKFKRNRDAIQLLILDVIMPGKNGKEVYEEVQAINPGVKVLFLSGYPNDVIHQKGILDEKLNFLPKPSSAVVLLAKIRELLDTRT